mgnify:FL=1
MTYGKSEKRWTPFATEGDFEDWFCDRMTALGCPVIRQPTYKPSSLETGNTITRRRSDVALIVPRELNSLDTSLFLIVELKNGDNARYLRQAARQIRGAMFGHDWRHQDVPIAPGSRPWRGLVLTPGQLHRGHWPDVSAPPGETGPLPTKLWELEDRKLTEDGASFLRQDKSDPDSWRFWIHHGQSAMVSVTLGR